MKLLDRLRFVFSSKSSSYIDDRLAALDTYAGRMVAGVNVSVGTALQVSTVLACVKVIADGCATPKLHVYRDGQDGGRREMATNIPDRKSVV